MRERMQEAECVYERGVKTIHGKGEEEESHNTKEKARSC